MAIPHLIDGNPLAMAAHDRFDPTTRHGRTRQIVMAGLEPAISLDGTLTPSCTDRRAKHGHHDQDHYQALA